MPEAVLWEELENLAIHVQGVLQLCSGHRDQEAAEARRLTSHFMSVVRGPEVVKVRSMAKICGLQYPGGDVHCHAGHLQCKRCHRFGHMQRYCGYAPWCVACGEAHLSEECSTQQQLKC